MEPKRVKRDNQELYGRIFYQFSLSNEWTLLVTTHAEKFYFNSVDGASTWQLPALPKSSQSIQDELGTDLEKAYEKLGELKDYILVVLAMIRGARVPMNIIKQVEGKLGLVLKRTIAENDSGYNDLELQENPIPSAVDASINDNYDDFEEDGNEEGEDDEDDENYGLDLSDIEDLLDENTEDVTLSVEVRDDTLGDIDQSMEPYIFKYPLIPTIVKNSKTTLSQAIAFIQFLESSKVDVYSSYHLEIEDLASRPEFVMHACNMIDDRIRNSLWDEYCRVIGNEIETYSSAKKQRNDELTIDMTRSDGLKFISFLKSYSENGNKLSKFYTDFNRAATKHSKSNGDTLYTELCKSVPMSVRQSLYNKFTKFTKIDSTQRINVVIKLLSDQGCTGTIKEVVDSVISEGRIVDFAELFFLDGEEFQRLASLRN
jgi:hypothetical protein